MTVYCSQNFTRETHCNTTTRSRFSSCSRISTWPLDLRGVQFVNLILFVYYDDTNCIDGDLEIPSDKRLSSQAMGWLLKELLTPVSLFEITRSTKPLLNCLTMCTATIINFFCDGDQSNEMISLDDCFHLLLKVPNELHFIT